MISKVESYTFCVDNNKIKYCYLALMMSFSPLLRYIYGLKTVRVRQVKDLEDGNDCMQ